MINIIVLYLSIVFGSFLCWWSSVELITSNPSVAEVKFLMGCLIANGVSILFWSQIIGYMIIIKIYGGKIE